MSKSTVPVVTTVVRSLSFMYQFITQCWKKMSISFMQNAYQHRLPSVNCEL